MTPFVKRLKKLEARQPAAEDDGAVLASLMTESDLVAKRLRAEPGWQEPSEPESSEFEREWEAMVAGLGELVL
jgi:hypothetical protein